MKNLVLLVALSLVAGCYHTTLRTGKTPNGVVIEKNAPMFLAGLSGAELDAPCEPAIVETYQSVGDWFISLLTLYIYTPRSVTIHCGDSKTK